MRSTFLQSADASVYRDMLNVTSKTVQKYAEDHNFDYRSHIGIIRGCFPWHANFNRILLLKEFVDSKRGGWVIYMDADAYIASFDFDLSKFLDDINNSMLYAASAEVDDREWWNVNNGIFFLNLDHKLTPSLIDTWLAEFMSITERELERAHTWNLLSGSQSMLHKALRSNPDFKKHTITDYTCNVINSKDAVFARQLLRAEGNVIYRLNRIIEDIQVLHGSKIEEMTCRPPFYDYSASNEEFIKCLYTCILFREPDSEGLLAKLEGLNTSTSSFAHELAAFFRSEEFGSKITAFLEAYQGYPRISPVSLLHVAHAVADSVVTKSPNENDK